MTKGRLGGLAFVALSTACSHDNGKAESPPVPLPQGGVAVETSVQRDTAPTVAAADLSAVEDSNTAFAAALHGALRSQTGNLVYSPYGISTIMAMEAAWSSGGSGYSDDTAKVLGYTLPPDRLFPAIDALDLAITAPAPEKAGVTLLTSNLLCAEHLSDDTIALIAREFGSPLCRLSGFVDFYAVNQIQFKGTWQTGFDPSRTAPAPFTLADGTSASVPTMATSALLRASQGANQNAIEIPYQGGGVSLFVVVPKDLTAFETALTKDTFASVADSLTQPMLVQLAMPKFTIANQRDLLPVLAKLAWSNSGGAWTITQDASIDVDETGTVAEADTTAEHTPAAAAPSVPFSVDRPFFFFIRDKSTGTILFAGHVLDPRSGGVTKS
jgi:serpin B